MKENKKIKLLVVLVILIVIITVIQLVVEKNGKEVDNNSYAGLKVSQDLQGSTTEKSIEFKNSTILKELKGALQITTVMEKIEKTFLEEIPEILEATEDMSDAQLAKYYADNSADIRNNLNIDNEKSFLNMIEKYETITSDVSTDYKSCEFLDDGTISFVFSYENGEKIECDIAGEHANLVTFEF